MHYRVVLRPKNNYLLVMTSTKILFGDDFDVDDLATEFTLIPTGNKYKFVNNYEHGFLYEEV